MHTRHEYSDGAPCWADLSTPDSEGARRFYGDLLGWTIDASGPEYGGYINCKRDGETVCGMMQSQPGQVPASAWGIYLKTSDMAASVRAIREAGGATLMGPHEIPGELGTMLIAQDPTGGGFGLWQPGLHRGAERFCTPGGLCWAELNTRDGAAADDFFRRLFDYTLEKVEGGIPYMTYHVGGLPVCGRLQMTEAWCDTPPHWMIYFAVEDVDAAAARVPELGGKLCHGPFESPHGRIAVVTDPFGAAFSIIRLARPASAK
ncbi:MAG: VOC family protein [Nannocystaceae bacterium]